MCLVKIILALFKDDESRLSCCRTGSSYYDSLLGGNEPMKKEHSIYA
jgi:hypothetical protein